MHELEAFAFFGGEAFRDDLAKEGKAASAVGHFLQAVA